MNLMNSNKLNEFIMPKVSYETTRLSCAQYIAELKRDRPKKIQ